MAAMARRGRVVWQSFGGEVVVLGVGGTRVVLGPHCPGLSGTRWPWEPARAPFWAAPSFTCQDHSCTERVRAHLALPLAPAATSPCTVKGRSAGSGQEPAEECHLPSRAAAPGATCPRSRWGPALPPHCPPSQGSEDAGESQPRTAEPLPEPGASLRQGTLHPPAGAGTSVLLCTRGN